MPKQAAAAKQPLLDEDQPPAPTALAPRPPDPVGTAEVTLMFERLAKDPAVDVTKLERLMAMQERIIAHNRKAEFDAAFADMQGEIPEITEKGAIAVNGEIRSTYATNEDIQRVIKPILQKHGFSIRFRNEWIDNGRFLKVIGILSHRSGHSEQDEFIAQADTSGSKNAIQALGSTRSYGQRYTTIALLNIATRGEDDDGHKSEHYKHPEAPDGYEAWRATLEGVADEGLPALTTAWNKSKPEYRRYLTATDRPFWDNLKAIARQQGAS